ncbi:MAG TPA: amidohydrolase family protein, partial [Ilumatobacteraceae bacterium]|nr:amidohydrolase family protein [Ilumatobacteraceae bacterium]
GLTFKPASVLGLSRRGLLRKGYAADVVVFDPDAIEYLDTRMVDDLPSGASRLWRDSVGIDYVIVNGQVAIDADGYTGSRSGSFLRGREFAG